MHHVLSVALLLLLALVCLQQHGVVGQITDTPTSAPTNTPTSGPSAPTNTPTSRPSAPTKKPAPPVAKTTTPTIHIYGKAKTTELDTVTQQAIVTALIIAVFLGMAFEIAHPEILFLIALVFVMLAQILTITQVLAGKQSR
jgi:hypothetical protein